MALDVAAATQAVIQALLVPVIQYTPSASVAAGFVISQTPAAGTTVKVNTTVTLVVSNGPTTTVVNVTVPNVVGLAALAAQTSLAASAVSLDKYLWAVNAAAQGTVVAQSLASGSSVPPGTKVQLTLSAGPARVASTVQVPVAS